jgi:hypothetical protein
LTEYARNGGDGSDALPHRIVQKNREVGLMALSLFWAGSDRVKRMIPRKSNATFLFI